MPPKRYTTDYRCDDTCLLPQHLGGSARRIRNSRSASATDGDCNQPAVHEILSHKTKKKTNKMVHTYNWFISPFLFYLHWCSASMYVCVKVLRVPHPLESESQTVVNRPVGAEN